jgi:hypothetical protein
MMNALSAIIFKQLCGQKYNGKLIPDFVFNLDVEYQNYFIEQLIDGDGSRVIRNDGVILEFETASLKLISGLHLLMKMVGYENCSCQYNHTDKTYMVNTILRLDCGKHLVKNLLIENEDYHDYVYDLSVEGNNNFVDAFGNVLLHNTDSAFFVLRDISKLPDLISGIKERCKELAINKFNADVSHLEVDYDKGFNKFIILAKKRYAGSLCYLDGRTLDGVLYVAGLEYKRTDQCPYLKKKQKELLEILLGSKPFSLGEAKDFINVAKRYIFQGDVSVDDITFGKKLTKDVSEYKAKTMHLKVVAEMTGDNEEVWVGDKVMYFIEGIDANGKPIPRPISKYTGKFSQVYYWNNLIYPPLMRILQVVYRDIDWSAYEVKTTGKRKNAEIGRMALW